MTPSRSGRPGRVRWLKEPHKRHFTAETDEDRSMGEVLPAYRDAIRECGCGRKPWPLLLAGTVGIGKTLAGLCMLDYVRGRTFYTTFSLFCETLVEAKQGRLHEPSRFSTRPVTPAMWWDKWTRADIAFCDEVGRRSDPTSPQREVMADMLDFRKGRPTIFASNLTLNEIASVFGNHTSSRLTKGTAVWLEGEDRRLL